MGEVIPFIERLNESDYVTIEKLAEENQGPRDIARVLRVSVISFMRIWRDKKSRIREAYELGRLQIEIKRGEVLHAMMTEKNVTAFQIHEKKSAERDFEDLKADVFGF